MKQFKGRPTELCPQIVDSRSKPVARQSY